MLSARSSSIAMNWPDEILGASLAVIGERADESNIAPLSHGPVLSLLDEAGQDTAANKHGSVARKWAEAAACDTL